MPPRFLAIVSVVGVLATGLTLYQLAPGATRADAIDAGVAAGTPVSLRCRVRLSEQGLAEAVDAGFGNRLVGKYGLLVVPGRQFFRFDGHEPGIAIDVPDRLELYGDEPCEVLEDAGTVARLTVVPHRCACRKASGACRVPNPDGGVALPAPFGTTLRPGWSGAGCERKPCIELAGESSWPAACPEG